MKIIAVVVGVLMALIATTAGLKNDICGDNHPKDGFGKLECHPHQSMFTYNAETNECNRVIYDGCFDAFNKFYTLEDCELICKEETKFLSEDK